MQPHIPPLFLAPPARSPCSALKASPEHITNVWSGGPIACRSGVKRHTCCSGPHIYCKKKLYNNTMFFVHAFTTKKNYTTYNIHHWESLVRKRCRRSFASLPPGLRVVESERRRLVDHGVPLVTMTGRKEKNEPPPRSGGGGSTDLGSTFWAEVNRHKTGQVGGLCCASAKKHLPLGCSALAVLWRTEVGQIFWKENLLLGLYATHKP